MAGQYFVRCLDDPGPMKVTLCYARYTAAMGAGIGPWLPQIYHGSTTIVYSVPYETQTDPAGPKVGLFAVTLAHRYTLYMALHGSPMAVPSNLINVHGAASGVSINAMGCPDCCHGAFTARP